MQLGEVEIIETWREGDIRYEKEVQRPDYDRSAPHILFTGNDAPHQATASHSSSRIRHSTIPATGLLCRWIPKVGRALIKNRDDLNFYDVIEYDPRALEHAPYRLPVSSSFPLLGEKVRAPLTFCIVLLNNFTRFSDPAARLCETAQPQQSVHKAQSVILRSPDVQNAHIAVVRSKALYGFR